MGVWYGGGLRRDLRGKKKQGGKGKNKTKVMDCWVLGTWVSGNQSDDLKGRKRWGLKSTKQPSGWRAGEYQTHK